MSSIGGTSGPRPDFGSVDAEEVTQLAEGIKALPSPGSGSWFDGTSSTKRLAASLTRDGKFDVADANALIRDAKDFGKITSAERNDAPVVVSNTFTTPESLAPMSSNGTPTTV